MLVVLHYLLLSSPLQHRFLDLLLLALVYPLDLMALLHQSLQVQLVNKLILASYQQPILVMETQSAIIKDLVFTLSALVM
ncbi:hypothetical protein BDF21DRAFT_413185 [Thamnidium elegans]|nr:hypothetical protein BDF21DRAFT_435496 [Thamnidium elegans]KAI8088416.1 hypothetical protein BDF21DRAFT_413172 [Thamnidium elegans]KAI8088420.1 hypothetical protein BDF21DRAFT_413183 [Thamnidium elegans]KAI8088421.1 hypothetical protein BDF21DRAFT_413185 [Thamnidium elegans]